MSTHPGNVFRLLRRTLLRPASPTCVTCQIISIFPAKFKFVVRFFINDILKYEHKKHFQWRIEGINVCCPVHIIFLRRLVITIKDTITGSTLYFTTLAFQTFFRILAFREFTRISYTLLWLL